MIFLYLLKNKIVIYTSSVRKKTFTPSFLASNFSKIHSNSNFPDDLTNLNGNPDPGDGLYADKLPYDLNINFNKGYIYFSKEKKIITLKKTITLK